jgi:hypothetical protein
LGGSVAVVVTERCLECELTGDMLTVAWAWVWEKDGDTADEEGRRVVAGLMGGV